MIALTAQRFANKWILGYAFMFIYIKQKQKQKQKIIKTFFCHFAVLSRQCLLSLLSLHFNVKYFEQKHPSGLPLYIFLPSKLVIDVRVSRTRTRKVLFKP